MSEWDAALRILVAAGLCGLLGIERKLRQKDAGTRTFMLVGIGAALFTVTGFALVDGRSIDPTRIAAQVASGVGFLGAGLIVRQGVRVRYLTTAAGIWATAAIGVAAGARLFVLASATTLIILVALPLVNLISGFLVRRSRRPRIVSQTVADDE